MCGLLAVISVRVVAIGPASAQTLGIAGDRFTIDGAPRFLLMLSYFDGMRAADLDADLAFIRRTLGFDGIRVFPNWWRYAPERGRCPSPADDTLFAGDGRIRGDGATPSGRLAHLQRLLASARKHGLVVDLSFTRETVPGGMSVASYARALQRTAFLLRAHRHVLFDLQNERDLERPGMYLTPDEVRELRNAVRDPIDGDPHRIVVASNSGGTAPLAGGGATDPAGSVGLAAFAHLDAVAQHDPRRRGWPEATTALVTALRRSGRPVYLQEPTRWRLATKACGQAEDGDSDADPAHFRTALANARAAGAAAWTFHSQRAFRLDGPSRSLRRQIEALPVDSPERRLLDSLHR
jgi:hypothetical protein